jgi:hypothetical protein
MEAKLKEADDAKRENDFKLISDELKRQFELLLQGDDSFTVKAGIVLGFIMVIIVQITLTTGYTDLIMARPTAFVFFLIGFLAIICAFALGIFAIYPKDFGYGPKVPKLAQQWLNQDKKSTMRKSLGWFLRLTIRTNKSYTTKPSL